MKKVAIITATRAEYGLFRPIIKAIASDPALDYHLIVTGMHLSPEFGSTVAEIERDGFTIHARLDVLNEADTGAGMAKYIGKLTTELAHDFEASRPDVLLLLGDRGEMLAGAIAASCMNMAIFHLHGGEESGSVDDHFRKSITKLSHLHLAATDEAKENLIAMGEKPTHIHVVGAPGLDGITDNLASREEIMRKLKFDPAKPLALMVQHPVTTEVEQAAEQIKITLDALVDSQIQTYIIFPNADPGGRAMIEVIKKYLAKHDFIKGRESQQRDDFRATMNAASFVIGNSSSGIIEAMSFKTPVINIGTRQQGRQRASNTLDVGHDRAEILAAIEKCLDDEAFLAEIEAGVNPYGDGHATGRIIKIIHDLKIDKKLLQKRY